MSGRHETEVLVVGAGPVGLYAALSLAKQGIGVQIVDEEWRTAAHSYACALHPATLKLLRQVDLLDQVNEEGARVEKMVIHEGATRHAEVNFTQLPMETPYLLVLRQSTLESLLERRLSKQGVKVRWNHRVADLQPQEKSVWATVNKMGKVSSGYAVATTEWVIEDSEEIEASFVLGADGRHSIVRERLGIAFEEVAEPQYFAVFEFQTDAPVEKTMHVVLDEHTTNVLWPLPGGYCRWSFQLRNEEIPNETRDKSRLAVQVGRDAFPFLTEECLGKLIQARAPWFRGHVGYLNWSMAVRFEQRLADDFGRGRCWLAGDAAHLAGPVGVQSMNVGFREADDLIWRFLKVLREGAPLDLLEGYRRERQQEWRCLMGLHGGLVSGDRAAPWVKANRDRLCACLPASGKELRFLADQLGLVVVALKGQ